MRVFRTPEFLYPPYLSMQTLEIHCEAHVRRYYSSTGTIVSLQVEAQPRRCTNLCWTSAHCTPHFMGQSSKNLEEGDAMSTLLYERVVLRIVENICIWSGQRLQRIR